PDWFSFEDILYEGEKELFYGLKFEDPTHFFIFDRKGESISGQIGERVITHEASFVIAAAPQKLKIGKRYSLQLSPLAVTYKEVLRHLKIANLKINGKKQPALFSLHFQMPERALSSQFLNALMAEYRAFLKSDYDQVVKDQLVYLEQKQEEICANLSDVFDQYTHYLQQHLTSEGALGIGEQISSLTKSYREVARRIDEIDLELRRVQCIARDDEVGFITGNFPFAEGIQQVILSLRNLKEQRDLVELSLQEKGFLSCDAKDYEIKKKELETIRNRRNEARCVLNGQSSFFDSSLKEWASRLEEATGVEKEDLLSHIENQFRLLSMQEEIAQEQLFTAKEIPSEFQGLHLDSARSLLVEYHGKLDQATAQLHHFHQLIDAISQDEFAISSLNAALTDPLSCKLIEQASSLVIHLKDEEHYSTREKERWQEELFLQKKILKEHVEQLCQVESLRVDLIYEKMTALQQIIFRCLNGQISVLHEQMSGWLQETQEGLTREKKLLEGKLTELKDAFDHFPEEWRMEKWMSFKTDLGMKTIGSVVDLVESKTIGRHLHHIDSKEIDFAIPPLHPRKSLLFSILLGSFLLGFGSLCKLFISALLNGFPISFAQLEAMRYPLLGELSRFCDGRALEVKGKDLDLLRKIALSLRDTKGKIVGLILGQGPDYSYALIKNLRSQGLFALIVRCDFSAPFQNEEEKGLLQFWQKEIASPPIVEKDGIAVVSSGGFTPYGTEILQSKCFQEKLNEWAQNYERVFLLLRTPLDSTMSHVGLSLSDLAIVSVVSESNTVEQLTPYMQWAYHENKQPLHFVVVAP
ncbi:MAG: hypothetical protein A3F67_01360, partial [Verrucomicrobia bacterium RIFCSPHIGHO2_12_FULL_41_10]